MISMLFRPGRHQRFRIQKITLLPRAARLSPSFATRTEDGAGRIYGDRKKKWNGALSFETFTF